MGLHEDIVRFLTIKIDEISENPSPMMNGKIERNRSESSENNFTPVANKIGE